MADIELVIKISEEDLDCIKYLKAKGWASRHELQILNGIPLPKGHGRLIDEDTIAGDGSWDWSDRLDATPTIIEADRENK